MGYRPETGLLSLLSISALACGKGERGEGGE